MPLRPARVGRVGVIGHPVAKTAVVARAVSLGKLMGLVNCAGIAPAEKTVGKNGAHNLGVYTKTIMVNLVGSFNMIRLAAEAMSKNEPEDEDEPPALEAGVLHRRDRVTDDPPELHVVSPASGVASAPRELPALTRPGSPLPALT